MTVKRPDLKTGSSLSVIAIGGVKGSGKDTVGGVLREQHDFTRTAFADPIKEMIRIAFPNITNEQLFGPTHAREESLGLQLRGVDPRDGKPMTRVVTTTFGGEKSYHWMADDGTTYMPDVTVRLLAQTLGTQWGRRIYEDMWVDACWHRMLLIQSHPGQRFCITDCRFSNEVRRVKELGGAVVKLLRGFDEAREKAELSSDNTTRHQSETEFLEIPDSEFDYVLDNRGELHELPDLVAEMLDDLAEKLEW